MGGIGRVPNRHPYYFWVNINNLESHEQIARLLQEGIVWGAAFSPDGRFFYTAAWDGTVRKWLVPPQDAKELIQWVLANR